MTPKTEYRKTLGSFATGVTIITSSIEEEHYGFTANSFTSVSLDPPLVLFCIKEEANFIDVIKRSGIFGVNVLSKSQEHLSNRFANPNLINSERFENVEFDISKLGCPQLSDTLAFIECKIQEIIKAGDHFIVLGKVTNYLMNGELNPLLYFRGGYATVDK